MSFPGEVILGDWLACNDLVSQWSAELSNALGCIWELVLKHTDLPLHLLLTCTGTQLELYQDIMTHLAGFGRLHGGSGLDSA